MKPVVGWAHYWNGVMTRSEGLIRVEALDEFPQRPESEFEWEDLLLRLEIMPRALRVELERAKKEEAPAILAVLTEREETVQRLLEAVAVAGVAPGEPGIPSGAEASVSASGAGPADGSEVERFVRLRGRNFAMLQRRGIDVWNWKVRIGAAGEATVFQLLSFLAHEDVETLARLRQARRPVVDTC